MELNNIKKALYKHKPMAVLVGIMKDGITYTTYTTETGVLMFRIPFNDIGEYVFANQEDAKLLIRWLVTI